LGLWLLKETQHVCCTQGHLFYLAIHRNRQKLEKKCVL